MRPRRAIASTLMAAVALHLGGCTTWKVQELSPEQVIAEQSPNQVRVTKTDGTQFRVWEPRVRSDSLVGLGMPDNWGGARRRNPDKVPVSVPVEEIRALEVHGTDAVKTGIAVVGGLVLAGALVVSVHQMSKCTASSYFCF